MKLEDAHSKHRAAPSAPPKGEAMPATTSARSAEGRLALILSAQNLATQSPAIFRLGILAGAPVFAGFAPVRRLRARRPDRRGPGRSSPRRKIHIAPEGAEAPSAALAFRAARSGKTP